MRLQNYCILLALVNPTQKGKPENKNLKCDQKKGCDLTEPAHSTLNIQRHHFNFSSVGKRIQEAKLNYLFKI